MGGNTAKGSRAWTNTPSPRLSSITFFAWSLPAVKYPSVTIDPHHVSISHSDIISFAFVSTASRTAVEDVRTCFENISFTHKGQNSPTIIRSKDCTHPRVIRALFVELLYTQIVPKEEDNNGISTAPFNVCNLCGSVFFDLKKNKEEGRLLDGCDTFTSAVFVSIESSSGKRTILLGFLSENNGSVSFPHSRNRNSCRISNLKYTDITGWVGLDVEMGVDKCSALSLIEGAVEEGGRGGVGVIDGVDENDGVTKLNDNTGRKDEEKDKEEEEEEVEVESEVSE